jgi:hypothetical protein
MNAGRRERRALEGDLVFGAVRIVLHRLAVVLDRRVPIAGTRGALASHKRPARRARGQRHGKQDDDSSFSGASQHV